MAGCSAPAYWADRKRDAADIFTFIIGEGWGLKGRVSFVNVGAFYNSDFWGLRCGTAFALSRDKRWRYIGEVVSPVPLPVQVGHMSPWWWPISADSFDIEHLREGYSTYTEGSGLAARRGKQYGAGMFWIPFLSFSDRPFYYTEVEAAGGLWYTARLGFNPGELLDFLLGWTTIDIFDDDVGIGFEMPKPEAGIQPPAFNSAVAFSVYAVVRWPTGEENRLVGSTPSERSLTMPPCRRWYVEPLPPVDMAKVCQEVEARRIPGLRLSHVTDAADLERLRGLTTLQQLDLSYTKVTDAGLAHLKGLTGLQYLDLSCTQVTDAGLAHLKGLTGLQYLDLSCTQVTGAGMVHLRGLTALQELDLPVTRVTDPGLAHLKGLTALQRLNLLGTEVTDAGLEHLKGLTALQDLNLWDTKVTDAGLVYLKGLTALQDLNLSETNVTDAGLEHLKGLTALQKLDLERTKVTNAGVRHLKKSLPNVEVRR
jgi:hypothetical protein